MAEDVVGRNQDWVENILSRLDMVEWDRFVVGNQEDGWGLYISVYGWIEREDDDYKDYVQVEFYPETDRNLMGFTTSSERWTDEIYRRMFDAEPKDHNGCRRVEENFDIPNAIQLQEQSLNSASEQGGQANE